MTAVMQPYLFPYAGYYQLALATDRFIFYDDVQFIAQGWINRNRLPHGLFTVPLRGAGHTDLIRDRRIAPREYAHFLRKWRRGFRQRYARAAHLAAVEDLLDRVFLPDDDSLAELAERSIREVCAYLGGGPAFARASDYPYARHLAAQDRLLSLLAAVGTTDYVNPVGGSHLYDQSSFVNSGIRLRFFASTLNFAEEADPGFGFSILHLLAHHPPARIREWLTEHYTMTTTAYDPNTPPP